MWKVGDQCLAQYAGDGEYYPAVVRSIKGGKCALVKYCEYSSDENETVPFQCLKEACPEVSRNRATEPRRSQQAGFVSPLRYLPEEVRLRDKYADLDKEMLVGFESSASSSHRSSPSSPRGDRNRGNRKVKKQTVAVGGDTKIAAKRQSEQVDSSGESPRVVKRDVPQGKVMKCTVLPVEGFTDEELEKPYFPGKTDAGPKVPFVLSEEGTECVQIPATMNRYLREYQREGVQFLYMHFQKENGAILADDMGLGKTIQVLSFICAILRKKGNQEDCQRSLPLFLRDKTGNTSAEVFLIVCPNSVLYNWLEELDTWTYCSVGKYHGKDREETLSKASRGRIDVVVTTFETYRTKLESLLEVNWTAIVVDEVHKIKESNSQITVALKKINTKRRYGLTGTALQNKMGELWCILDWANPGCLGSWKAFRKKYEIGITKGQRYDASKRELAAGRKAALEFSKLRKTWLLRRTKSIIADQLPAKDEKVVFCKLTDLQISISRAILNSEEMKVVLMQHDPCDCGSGLKKGKCHYKRTSDGLSVKAVTFSLMSALIKAVNHAALLIPSPGMPSLQKQLSEKIFKLAFASHAQFVRMPQEARLTTLSDSHYCGKMLVLKRLLDVFKKEGSKVLLFSYYTKLLDILEMYLRTTDYIYFRMDGKTPASERQKLVSGFNRDLDVFLFLISTKAGGMGLNLTGANVVIIFDPNWNPMYDIQAQDRAYRIGQHRDVRVYRLISTGCIEENMYLRQVYKQQLSAVAMTTENAKRYFTAVAGENKQKGEIFGLENLFSLRTEGSCLTRDLIQRELKTERGITTAKYIALNMKAGDHDEEEVFGVENEMDDKDDLSVRDEVLSGTEDEDTHGLASQLCDDSSDHISSSQEIEDDVAENERRRHHKKCGSDDSSDHISPSPEMDGDVVENVRRRHHKKDGCDDSSGHISPSQEIGDDVVENVRRRHHKKYGSRRRFDNLESSSSDEDGNCRMKKGKAIVKKGGIIVSKAKTSRQDMQERDSNNESCRLETARNLKVSSAVMENSDLQENDPPRSRKYRERRKMGVSSVGKREARSFHGEEDDGDMGDVDDADEGEDEGEDRELDFIQQPDGNADMKVFRDCGVTYIHSNMKVIGPSRVEDHVSKTALADVYENSQYSQEPAFCRVPTLEQNSGSESDDVELKQLKAAHSSPSKSPESKTTSLKPAKDKETKRGVKKVKVGNCSTHRLGERRIFVGQTPLGIRREQFKDMAKVLEYKSINDLASAILRRDKAFHTDLLLRYYQLKYPSLNVASHITSDREVQRTGDRECIKATIESHECQTSEEERLSLQLIKEKHCQVQPRERERPEGLTFRSSSDDAGRTEGCDGTRTTPKTVKRPQKVPVDEFDEFEEMKQSFVRDGSVSVATSDACTSAGQEVAYSESSVTDVINSRKTGRNPWKEVLNVNKGNLCNSLSNPPRSKESSFIDFDTPFDKQNSGPTLRSNSSLDQESCMPSSLSFLDDIFLSPLTTCTSSANSSKPSPRAPTSSRPLSSSRH